MPPSPSFALIAGAGSGLGASVARRFAKSYPVVLLARKETTIAPTVEAINKAGGKAVGIPIDISDATAMGQLKERLEKEFPGQGCAAAIFNASAAFVRKPFLEMELEQFKGAFEVSVTGAFLFSQLALPYLLKAKSTSQYPPSLIFTGATASVKSNALMSAFATGKHALRALALSLAKEFGPQGIHVGHAVIDGGIDTPWGREFLAKQGIESQPESKIDPDEIAEAYWHLHTQPRSCFSNEIDIRPAMEKW